VGGYNYLVELGVKFPGELFYFKPEEIEVKVEKKVQNEENKVEEENKDSLIEKINYYGKQRDEFMTTLQEKKHKNMPECNFNLFVFNYVFIMNSKCENCDVFE